MTDTRSPVPLDELQQQVTEAMGRYADGLVEEARAAGVPADLIELLRAELDKLVSLLPTPVTTTYGGQTLELRSA